MVLVALAACGDSSQILSRDPREHESWAAGFQVVPPVALPRPSEQGHVEVWLALPRGASLRATSEHSEVLDYPAFTLADRVEVRNSAFGERVVDVRGTRIDADGVRWHHVFQPVSTDPDADLVGVEWPADDPVRATEAVDAFLGELAAHGRRNLDAVRAKLDCDRCHVADRPANTRAGEHGFVSRGTDGAGFFTPSTLLSDSVPAELYGLAPGPAPFTSWRCAEHEVPAGTRRCADGTLPVAEWDHQGALLAGDPHAAAAEASRTHLALALGRGR
ncbi:MAG: hypothetical protein R3F61_06790 [Myxococcota bacterium]